MKKSFIIAFLLLFLAGCSNKSPTDIFFDKIKSLFNKKIDSVKKEDIKKYQDQAKKLIDQYKNKLNNSK